MIILGYQNEDYLFIYFVFLVVSNISIITVFRKKQKMYI